MNTKNVPERPEKNQARKTNAIENRDALLSRRQLAARWGVSGMTIRRREQAGLLSSLRFNSRLVRYRLQDVLRCEEAAGGGSQ